MKPSQLAHMRRHNPLSSLAVYKYMLQLSANQSSIFAIADEQGCPLPQPSSGLPHYVRPLGVLPHPSLQRLGVQLRVRSRFSSRRRPSQRQMECQQSSGILLRALCPTYLAC